MNEKIGVIVDGQGDFHSLKKRFSNSIKVLKTDGPRGHEAKSKDIVIKSKKQVKILKAFKCDTVIVLLDLEQRSQSYEDFVNELNNIASQVNFGTNVIFTVCNRMIENWYLSDIVTISQQITYIRNNLRQKKYEGKHGKEELKKLFKKGISFSYNEVSHGPQMFNVISLDIARRNSKSFDDFLTLINY